MSITKTDAGTYFVEVFYPKDIRGILGVKVPRYRKTVATKLEAKTLQKQVDEKIKEAQKTQSASAIKKNGEMLFKNFYREVWWPLYAAGATGRIRIIPSEETQANTRNIFRLHLLPMFGEYSMTYLNLNKQFVMQELAILSEKYANIRTVKSYVSQMFDTAEMVDFIDVNRLEKAISSIGSPKKERLATRRKMTGESLSADEMVAWLDAANTDHENGKLSDQDYLLLLLTLHLGDRKGESYGLQWKHVDFNTGYVLIIQALKKSGKVGPTKAKKETSHALPPILIPMLREWHDKQAIELAEVNLESGPNQFLFTYTNFQGGINQPLHADYLNYRLNSIYKRHPDLVRVTPHKLRHTFSTLARQGGASLQLISEALSHSSIKTTRVYVNTPDIVGLDVHDKFAERIAQARANSLAQEMKLNEIH
ncbi:tyrosine-type recombinase/integrase [Lacticaseibacillus paracasei]|uniref:site-specific integrase n=1 Tax=Lacticaseibacillus paracasei TaxID=1597 RepID=UPI00223196E3|nr:tyrosine-type recombinase/integrase [Lacticaseibacillus paracasei]UZD25797.1 tyrosine-type recombinase/integrase [Lacticaseibacillus paracasei]